MKRVLVFALGIAACREATSTPAPAPARGPAITPSSSAAPASAPDAAPDAELAPVAPTRGSSTSDATDVADAAPSAPPDMRLVPAGTFAMGADGGGEEDEHPSHAVTLAAYWLDRTHVTQEAYARCVAAGACRAPDRTVASRAHAGPDATFQGPRQPVVGVSWDDASAYCAWAGKRLPREAEYERAIRGDDGRRFPWGNEPPTPAKAVFGRAFGSKGATTDDVGTHPEGRGPFGHDDLVGNVWEWVEDAYDPIAYRRATANVGRPGSCAEILAVQDKLRAEGKQGFTGSNPIPSECERVLRGGAFNYDAHGLRASNRVHHPGRFRLVMAGFRCARDAP